MITINEIIHQAASPLPRPPASGWRLARQTGILCPLLCPVPLCLGGRGEGSLVLHVMPGPQVTFSPHCFSPSLWGADIGTHRFRMRKLRLREGDLRELALSVD